MEPTVIKSNLNIFLKNKGVNLSVTEKDDMLNITDPTMRGNVFFHSDTMVEFCKYHGLNFFFKACDDIVTCVIS